MQMVANTLLGCEGGCLRHGLRHRQVAGGCQSQRASEVIVAERPQAETRGARRASPLASPLARLEAAHTQLGRTLGRLARGIDGLETQN